MPRVAYAFFTLAAGCGLVGMLWGLWMGSSESMATAPAHAHLNAVGFLGLAAMGAFHALARREVPPRLAWTNFWLSGLGAVLLPAGIALILLGHRAAVPLGIGGGLLALGGMFAFLAAVVTGSRRTAG